MSSGWKCNNRKLEKERERCFFKSKIRACGGGWFGRADMIQRGQRDVRFFLKKWTFNDPLGDSVGLTAEDEEGRRCSDYTKKVKISALMQLTAQHHSLQLPPLLPPPGQEISNSTLRVSTLSMAAPQNRRKTRVGDENTRISTLIKNIYICILWMDDPTWELHNMKVTYKENNKTGKTTDVDGNNDKLVRWDILIFVAFYL